MSIFGIQNQETKIWDFSPATDWNNVNSSLIFSELKFFQSDDKIAVYAVAKELSDLASSSKLEFPCTVLFTVHSKPYQVGFKDKRKEVKPSAYELWLFNEMPKLLDASKCYAGKITFTSNEDLLESYQAKGTPFKILEEVEPELLKDLKPQAGYQSKGGGRGGYEPSQDYYKTRETVIHNTFASYWSDSFVDAKEWDDKTRLIISMLSEQYLLIDSDEKIRKLKGTRDYLHLLLGDVK